VDLQMALTGQDFKTAAAEVEKIVGRPTTSRIKRRIKAVYDYCDEDSNVLYQVVRYEPKDFSQRRPDGKGGFIPDVKGVRRVPYRLPRLKSAERVLIVEGEKDVERLEALGYVATCNSEGAGKWRAEFGGLLKGKDIVVIPDNDVAGQKHAADVIASLLGNAKQIRLLPIPIGNDVTEWIERGATKEAIDAAIAVAMPLGQGEVAGRCSSESALASKLAVIYVDDRQLRDIRADGLKALVAANTPPTIFIRDRYLADLRSREDGRPVINDVTEIQLRGTLSNVASFYVHTKSGRVSVPPPLYLAQDIVGCREVVRRFPGISGITEIPVLRPDGTVLLAAGYDPATRLYYSPAPDLQVPLIPETPTEDDVQGALELIDSAIGDFPFVYELSADLKYVAPELRDTTEMVWSASKANALGVMITTVVRPVISGPTPLALIDAPAPGTGKTLFTEIIAKIATGRDAALFSAPGEEEEWRKQITSFLREGVTVVVIDNVSAKLESAQLSKVLTASTWADRILGYSQTVVLQVQCTFIATGNNLRVGGDLPRRCYWIRLDAKTPAPYLRTGFRHSNLRAWTRDNRGQLIAALLTLARAWFVAGKPRPAGLVLGSYESWTEVVGGILDNANVKGFLANAAELREQCEAEDEAEQASRFFGALYDILAGKQFTSAEVHQLCHQEATAPRVRMALPPELAESVGVVGVFERSLGRWLGSRADRRFGESQIHVLRAGVMHKVQLWKVVNPTAGDELVQ